MDEDLGAGNKIINAYSQRYPNKCPPICLFDSLGFEYSWSLHSATTIR